MVKPAKVVYCRSCKIVIGTGHVEQTPYHIGRKTFCGDCFLEITTKHHHPGYLSTSKATN